MGLIYLDSNMSTIAANLICLKPRHIFKIKLKYNKPRVAYYCNKSTATFQLLRDSTVRKAFFSGDVELNQGPDYLQSSTVPTGVTGEFDPISND